MTTHQIPLLGSVLALALLTGCAYNPPRSDPYGNNAGSTAVRPATSSTSPYGVQYGRVSNIEVVPIAARTSGAGAVLGAVLGGVLGHQVGGGTGRTVATGAGVIGGALIGNSIEQRNKTDSEIYRVSVRLDNGSVSQYDYQRIDDLRIGDQVKVEGGQLSRY